MAKQFTLHDIALGLSDALSTATQLSVDGTRRNMVTAQVKEVTDAYDEGTRSWEGEGSLRYRVPMVTMLPSEAHARAKSRNVRILMDNVRELSVNDQLPATADEKQFWASYRFLKYQMFLQPFLYTLVVSYLGAKLAFRFLPGSVRGRVLPFAVAGLVAEQWMDNAYPAHNLLTTALTARTPLGDAARAEWQRLQPVTVSSTSFSLYRWRRFMRDPMPGFAFGGDAIAACK
jgi:hypothetical protein